MEQLLLGLNDIFQQFSAYAKTNPVIAGAMSLWGLGVLTFLLRSVPSRIWGFIKHQSTTTLTFTSDPIGTNAQTFVNFMTWFEENQGRWRGFSRSIALNSVDRMQLTRYGRTFGGATTQAGVGAGWHFFTYKGCPMWMRRNRLDKGSIQNLVYEIEITMIGRNRQRLLDLVEDFRWEPPSSEESLGVYTWSDNNWYRSQDVPPRPLRSVIIRRDIKESLIRDVQQWRESRAWYEERGLPYKLTCLLRGMPGTGKTSLIKALASHLAMNVCVLNLNKMTDDSLPAALSEAEPNSIIVIEDFDSTTATRARNAMKPRPGASPDAKEIIEEANAFAFGLTLSGILNSLDGIVSLHDKILFLTTNVAETLDPALLRKGRVDISYEIGRLGDAEVREYIALMFPGTEVHSHPFDDILGCDLQDLYFQHRNDADAFVASIPRIHHVASLVLVGTHD